MLWSITYSISKGFNVMKELGERAYRNGSCPSRGLDPSLPWTEKELVSEEWG